jgi:hypothetical protein
VKEIPAPLMALLGLAFVFVALLAAIREAFPTRP